MPAVELTPRQYKNYLKLSKHVSKSKEHPLKCPEEKELDILIKLQEGLSDRQIIRDLKTSVYTVQRVRKDYGLWGQ